jgi:glycosyltransferase involved in cell wall biosynthesis
VAPASAQRGDLAGGGVPRVSVVVRCYRQARFLPEAVASVAAQTFGDWELVIVDDGSPDDTREVAAALQAAHPGHDLRLVSRPNGGPARALNTGVEAARAELVLPLDADDALHPTYLEKAVRALDEDPAASIAFTDVVLWGAVASGWRMGPFTLPALRARNRLCLTSLFRKQLWREVGGFRGEMELGYEDWDFWLGCAERGALARHLHQPLFFYRMHAGGTSTNTVAMRHHRQLVATVALNHPAAFGPQAVDAARVLLAEQPLPSRRAAASGTPAT